MEILSEDEARAEEYYDEADWAKGHGETEFFFHISTTKLPVSEQNLVYEVTPVHFADC